MSGGQWLVFWCCVLGLVVVVLSEWFRWRNRARGDYIGRHPSARLRAEIERHDPIGYWPLDGTGEGEP